MQGKTRQTNFIPKKFLIIGNKNAIAYKEVFTLVQSQKMWLGYRNVNADMWFIVPENYSFEKIANGKKVKHIMGCWFTNLDTSKRHEVLPLYKKYSSEEYPEYDNYDAIEVSKTSDIPYDYKGIMGVPITFLDKYNPEQFEIIGMGTGDTAKMLGVKKNYRGRTDLAYTVNGKSQCPYNRILIRRK